MQSHTADLSLRVVVKTKQEQEIPPLLKNLTEIKVVAPTQK